jgi:predicted signal transduction protein with EAL and GGDEF domain
VIERILAELEGAIPVRWGRANFPATARTAEELIARADAAAGLAAN